MIMKRSLICVLVVLSVIACAIGYSVYAGTEDPKVQNIAYVNSEVILSTYAPTAEAMQRYNQYSAQMEDLDIRAQGLLDPIRNEYYDKISEAGTEELQVQLQLEFQDAIQKELEDAGLLEEFDTLQIAIQDNDAGFQKHLGVIQDSIKAVAEELGIDMVLEAQVVIYGGRDITMEVMNYLSSLKIVTMDENAKTE